MTNYRVVVPLAGLVSLDVEAETPAIAVRLASKEIATRVRDLNSFDSDFEEDKVESQAWVPKSDDAQVTDLDDADEESNFYLVDGDVFQEETKGAVGG